MRKRDFFRIAASLIIISVLFSQLVVNLMHTHPGKGPVSAIVVKANNDNGSTPCKVCSLDVAPTLYLESFHLLSVDESTAFFAESVIADVPLSVFGYSLGRAPPLR